MCPRAGESAWVSTTIHIRSQVLLSPCLRISYHSMCGFTLCPRSFKKNCLICRYRFSVYVGECVLSVLSLDTPCKGFFVVVYILFLMEEFWLVPLQSLRVLIPTFLLHSFQIKTIWYNAFCLYGGTKGRLYLHKQHNQIF